VQEIKRFFLECARLVKHGYLVIFSHFYQFGLCLGEISLDFVLCLERSGIFWHCKDRRHGSMESTREGKIGLLPEILGQKEGFLRGTSTFDGHGRHGEDCFASLKLLKMFVSF
jgi:hypothetical protein